MCEIWRQSDKYILRYAPETKCSQTAQRRNIIFSSAILRIEFRLKKFKLSIIHLEVSHMPKNCYLTLFSYKVIGKRRGKTGTEAESIAPSSHLRCRRELIKGLIIWRSKCHQNSSPVVCDGYVKYEEAEVNGLVDILKKQITAAAARAA